MVYPFPYRTTLNSKEIFHQEIRGITSAGTIAAPISLPPGAYAVGFTIQMSNNDQAVTFEAAPYIDYEQTIVGGSYKFLETGSTTASVTITFAATATGTTGWSGVLVPAGDQYGAAAPVMVVHGTEMTLGSTSTTGTFIVAYTAVEF